MVLPTNLNPRRFKSWLRASDCGVLAGTSWIDFQAFCFGSWPTNPQTYSSNVPNSFCTGLRCCAGTPHSVSWYRTYCSVFAHGQRFISAPGPLHRVPQPPQFGGDPLPNVALNLDAAVLDRPAGPAPLSDRAGQFLRT